MNIRLVGVAHPSVDDRPVVTAEGCSAEVEFTDGRVGTGKGEMALALPEAGPELDLDQMRRVPFCVAIQAGVRRYEFRSCRVVGEWVRSRMAVGDTEIGFRFESDDANASPAAPVESR